MNYITRYCSPLGEITLASDGYNLIALWLEGQKGIKTDCSEEKDKIEVFIKTKRWLNRYFKGLNPEPSEIPIKLQGSNFALEVWEILQKIPYGQTMTYGEIAKIMAKKLGKQKMSAQAVGGAVGRNPISIIIPCHRVVGANGKLTGYAGGLDKKVKLLKHENAI